MSHNKDTIVEQKEEGVNKNQLEENEVRDTDSVYKQNIEELWSIHNDESSMQLAIVGMQGVKKG